MWVEVGQGAGLFSHPFAASEGHVPIVLVLLCSVSIMFPKQNLIVMIPKQNLMRICRAIIVMQQMW